jgi:hypothetical protein
MVKFEIGQKVVYKENTYTVITRKKNFSTKKIIYILEGVEEEVEQSLLSPVTDHNEAKKKFAQDLIEHEEQKSQDTAQREEEEESNKVTMKRTKTSNKKSKK